MNKAEEFRNNAEQCRQKAELGTNGTSEEWLKLAAEWDLIADQAERLPDLFK